MTVPNAMTPVSVLRESVETGLVNLRVNDYPLVNLMVKQDTYQDNVKFPVNVSTTAASGVSDAAAAPAASSDSVIGASLPCGAARFSHTIRLTKNDIAQAAAIGVEPLKDLFASHVDAGLQRIMQALETNLYTGTGNAASGGIFGLATAAAATGAYANLNPATAGQEAWSSYVAGVTAASIAANASALEDAISAAKTGIAKKGGNFDLIVCDPDVLALYEKAYNKNGKQVVMVGKAAQLASLGYNNYDYSGRPIVSDVYCPANTLYFIDTRTSALYTRRSADTQKMGGLNVLVGQIASDTATAVVYEIAVFPQLVVKKRTSAARLNIT